MRYVLMAMLMFAITTPATALDVRKNNRWESATKTELFHYEVLPQLGSNSGFQAQLVSPVDRDASAFVGYNYTKAPEDADRALLSEDYLRDNDNTMMIGLRFRLH